LTELCWNPIADVDLISLISARLGVEKKHVIGLPAFEHIHVASRPGFFGKWFRLLGIQRNGRVEVVSAAVQGERVPLVHILPGHANERPAALRRIRVHIALGVEPALQFPGSGLAVFTVIAGEKLAVERDPITVFVAAPARPLCATKAVVGIVSATAVPVSSLAIWFKRRIFL
jgi:hypothetical protein